MIPLYSAVANLILNCFTYVCFLFFVWLFLFLAGAFGLDTHSFDMLLFSLILDGRRLLCWTVCVDGSVDIWQFLRKSPLKRQIHQWHNKHEVFTWYALAELTIAATRRQKIRNLHWDWEWDETKWYSYSAAR